MPVNINCVCHSFGECTHQAAPRRLMGRPVCILATPIVDLRVPAGCALQTRFKNPLHLRGGFTVECPPMPPVHPARREA